MRARSGGAPLSRRLVRPGWVMELMSACQHFVFDIAASSEPTGDPTRKLLAALPPARSRVEELLHRVALTRLAAGYTARRHPLGSRHRGLPDSIARILLDDSEPPAAAFERWSGLTFKPRMAHMDLADRAGGIIRLERVAGRLDVTAIARSLSSSERDLRLAFRRCYGTSPSQYHRIVRALHGLDLLRASDSKNDAIARDLGFQSAKDFYRLMKEVTGLTPRRVRSLSPSQAAELRERLRKSLRLPEQES